MVRSEERVGVSDVLRKGCRFGVSKNVEVRELRTEDEPARAIQPVVENGRIDPAEIDGVPWVAVLEFSEVRIGAMEAGTDARAREEHGRRRAVIGAKVGILGQPTTKLREHEEQHATGFTRPPEVPEKR